MKELRLNLSNLAKIAGADGLINRSQGVGYREIASTGIDPGNRPTIIRPGPANNLEHFRSPHTPPPIPFSSGFGLLQSGGVNSNGCAGHCSSRDRRRRRASSQGMR